MGEIAPFEEIGRGDGPVRRFVVVKEDETVALKTEIARDEIAVQETVVVQPGQLGGSGLDHVEAAVPRGAECLLHGWGKDFRGDDEIEMSSIALSFSEGEQGGRAEVSRSKHECGKFEDMNSARGTGGPFEPAVPLAILDDAVIAGPHQLGIHIAVRPRMPSDGTAWGDKDVFYAGGTKPRVHIILKVPSAVEPAIPAALHKPRECERAYVQNMRHLLCTGDEHGFIDLVAEWTSGKIAIQLLKHERRHPVYLVIDGTGDMCAKVDIRERVERRAVLGRLG